MARKRKKVNLSMRKSSARQKKAKREDESTTSTTEENSAVNEGSAVHVEKSDLATTNEENSDLIEPINNDTVSGDADSPIVSHTADAATGARDEFVFTPMPNVEESALSQPQPCSSTSTETSVSVSCNVSVIIMRNEEESSSSRTLSPRPSVEIIDVDDLPDRPDSPIGDDVIEIIPETVSGSSSPEISMMNQGFVDLTENESIASESPNIVDADEDADEDDDEPLSHWACGGSSKQVKPSLSSASGSTSSTPSPLSVADETEISYRKKINCPICMDDYNQIVKDGKQLTSTPCGHVFCDKCILAAVEAQSRCPTCRNKLKKKQLHPLFL